LQWLTIKDRKEKNGSFAFGGDMTFVSHLPIENKILILVSSMHHDEKIDNKSSQMQKPEMITIFNFSKAGIVTVCDFINFLEVINKW
jgi:hypothetical protein